MTDTTEKLDLERVPCVEALLNYTQADADGIIVTVSRQAIHETVDALEAARSQVSEMKEALEKAQNFLSHVCEALPGLPDTTAEDCHIWLKTSGNGPQSGTFATLSDARTLLAALASIPTGGGETAAARDVLAERKRQVTTEGWTPDHDDEHCDGQMATAAAAYAVHSAVFRDAKELGHDYPIKAPHPLWPWDRSWWKPKSPRRDLVRAGALILAEIERLDRAKPSTGEGE